MNSTEFLHAFDRLTHRRKEVLLKLLVGETDSAIAQTLHITEATVRKHIEQICKIFGLKNEFPDERRSKRPELIALFQKYKPELFTALPTRDRVTFPQEESIQFHKQTVHLSLLSSPSPPYSSAFSQIYNRDVFILIDQSGSMTLKDEDTGDQTRYEYLEEVVQGHVAQILSAESQWGEKICEKISVFFFSKNEPAIAPFFVRDPGEVRRLFQESRPKTKTFIAPTLAQCLDIWMKDGKPKQRGAFFIIYTDGEFDDENQFFDCISQVCAQISDEKIAKIFVLGLGKDIDIPYFLELDFNINQEMPFNIVVFDLVNEADDIVHLLERQLMGDPALAFPGWVKRRYPEFVQKVIKLRQKMSHQQIHDA